VHRDMVGLVALDFILRVFLDRVVCIPFLSNIFGVHLNDLAADVPGLRIPGHVIADLKSSSHVGFRGILLQPQRIRLSINRGIPESLCSKYRQLL
jgi:hypothetical protein